MLSFFLAFPPYLFTLTVLLESQVAVNPAIIQGEHLSSFTANHLISSSPVCTLKILNCANYSIENIHLMEI
jgi:hypothetical protein